MSESISRSMPAQNDLPAPVKIATLVRPFSISSNADWISETILELMALRLSGRLSVSVASWPVNSSVSVSYMSTLHISNYMPAAICALCEASKKRPQADVRVGLAQHSFALAQDKAAPLQGTFAR